MPIKGISEVRRLPRLGKIRLGVKETSQKTGNPYPRAVDYFVCNADQSTSEAAAHAFHQVYGDKPRALDIMFPVNDQDQFFAQFYRRYGSGSGLLCKGDGETAVEIDKETGEIREIECNPVECEWTAKKHCRPVGTLQFLLYKVPGLGAWQIDTSSYHSIVNLNSAIDFVRALTGGRIAMIPLKLVIKPREVQVGGRKKTVYVLDLAHEEVKLEEILSASRKSAAQLLLPAVNFNEAPDDLFPPEVLESNAPEPMPRPMPEKPNAETETKGKQTGRNGRKNANNNGVIGAQKAFFAGVEAWAKENGVDPKDAKEIAREILREQFGVTSCSELTAEQWTKAAAGRRAVIDQIPKAISERNVEEILDPTDEELAQRQKEGK